jgi:hypothetical protein
MLENEIVRTITKLYETTEEFERDYSVLKVEYYPTIKERVFNLDAEYEATLIEYIKKEDIK